MPFEFFLGSEVLRFGTREFAAPVRAVQTVTGVEDAKTVRTALLLPVLRPKSSFRRSRERNGFLITIRVILPVAIGRGVSRFAAHSAGQLPAGRTVSGGGFLVSFRPL